MFIRFVRAAGVEGMKARDGVFGAAYELRDLPDLDPYSAEMLEEHLAWFRENLAIPDNFSRSGSAEAEHTRGLSWFKGDADEAIGRVFALMVVLEQYGYMIEMLRTTRPGYIVYEDDHQVVAEPFADTPV